MVDFYTIIIANYQISILLYSLKLILLENMSHFKIDHYYPGVWSLIPVQPPYLHGD